MTTTILFSRMPWHLRWWRTAAQAVRAFLGAEARRRRAGAAFRTLSELDARTLRDLGIDRSELPSLAAHPDTAERRRCWHSTFWIT